MYFFGSCRTLCFNFLLPEWSDFHKILGPQNPGAGDLQLFSRLSFWWWSRPWEKPRTLKFNVSDPLKNAPRSSQKLRMLGSAAFFAIKVLVVVLDAGKGHGPQKRRSLTPNILLKEYGHVPFQTCIENMKEEKLTPRVQHSMWQGTA